MLMRVGRYFTVLRLGLPRLSTRDITYNGTVIPKGTTFFLNAWACNMGKLSVRKFSHLYIQSARSVWFVS